MPRPEPPREDGPAATEVLPERAVTYVNPETGQSGLSFKELVTQLPHLYPDIDPEALP